MSMDQRRAIARAKCFPQQEPTKFQVAREFEFSDDVIRKVVYNHYLIGDGQPYVCAGDLISDLIDYEAGDLEVIEDVDDDVTAASPSTDSLCEAASLSIDFLREETLANWRKLHCIACKNKKNILFLPCTHLLFCDKCYRNCKLCPVCEIFIEETITVYL